MYEWKLENEKDCKSKCFLLDLRGLSFIKSAKVAALTSLYNCLKYRGAVKESVVQF